MDSLPQLNRMTDLETQLIAKIGDAFDGVALGDGDSLNMTEYHDSGGCAPEFAKRAKLDERIDWRSIPDETLEQFTVTFCFTDLAGYRFYAAPYMVWTVHNHCTSDNFIADATIYAMDPTRHQFKRTSFIDWFTCSQTDAILAFLDYCINNGDTLDAVIASQNANAIRKLLKARDRG